MAQDSDIIESFEIFFDKMKKCIKYTAEPYLEKEGLRSHHLIFLSVIDSTPGISQKSIKDHVPYDKSRVSMVITELHDLGLVENTSSGKISSLQLTEEGHRIYSEARNILNQFRSDLLGGLEEEELAVFMRCIGKFDGYLDKVIHEHSSPEHQQP